MQKTPQMSPRRPDQVNARISDLGKDILLKLQDHYGLSQAGIIEMLLREEARRIGMLAVEPLKVDSTGRTLDRPVSDGSKQVDLKKTPKA